MSSRKILYFVNPISGTRGKEAILKLIKEETTQAGISFDITHTNKAGDYNYLASRIQQEGITDVVICGGDGSVNQVCSGLLTVPVRVGIIPMGSGNGLALAARIPKDTRNALRLIFNGTASRIDAFRINGYFSCMLCGLGFDAQVAHDFAQQSSRGLATYVRQTLKNYFTARPFPFRITTTSKIFSCEAWFVSIANSNQFGNQFTIAPRASLSDGLLDIVVVKKMNKLTLIWKVLQQVRAGKIKAVTDPDFEKDAILYFQTPALQIDNSAAAPLHIDGEPAATATAFDIRVLPGVINLIQG